MDPQYQCMTDADNQQPPPPRTYHPRIPLLYLERRAVGPREALGLREAGGSFGVVSDPFTSNRSQGEFRASGCPKTASSCSGLQRNASTLRRVISFRFYLLPLLHGFKKRTLAFGYEHAKGMDALGTRLTRPSIWCEQARS